MACNFIKVGSSATSCKESFSGVGSTIYAFTKSDLEAKSLTPTYSDTAAEFTAASFAKLPVVPLVVKSKTGKVTATSNPDGGGFSNVYTGRIANDMHTMSAVARIMNNRSDWGLLVPTGKLTDDGLKSYYVIYDPSFDIEFSMESDSGDAPDSDHGHTITVTQAPMLYPMPTWTPADAENDVTAADAASSYETSMVG